MTLRLARASSAAFAILGILAASEAQSGERRRADPEPVHQWTGFYIGGNIGYGLAGLTDNGPLAITTNMTGVIGGIQAGYNYQIDSIVLGVEADFQGSDQSTSYNVSLPVVGSFSVSQKIPWFGTARGRLGYAFSCGCVMAYGTLGVGYGAYEPSASAFGVTLSGHYEKAVLAAGGGIEFMVTHDWSAKLEALYLDTGNIGSPLQVPGVGPISMRVRDAITRVGVNYHF